MTFWDFDITLCEGEKTFKDGSKWICPLRSKCHRFWSEEYKKEAKRLGAEKWLSFVIFGDDFKPYENEKCDLFWEEK